MGWNQEEQRDFAAFSVAVLSSQWEDDFEGRARRYVESGEVSKRRPSVRSLFRWSVTAFHRLHVQVSRDDFAGLQWPKVSCLKTARSIDLIVFSFTSGDQFRNTLLE